MGQGLHCLPCVLLPVLSDPPLGPFREVTIVAAAATVPESASLWVLEERLSVMSSLY